MTRRARINIRVPEIHSKMSMAHIGKNIEVALVRRRVCEGAAEGSPEVGKGQAHIKKTFRVRKERRRGKTLSDRRRAS